MANPPKTYLEFIKRFPKLGAAWEAMRAAGADGPFDKKTALLVKLALSIGARQEGAVHSAVRKAKAAKISADEIENVVSLAASTLGLPATVAAWKWVRDELD